MILKKILTGFILLLFTIQVLDAQSALFVNTAADARFAGMGNTGYSINSGAFATNYNSAGIVFSENKSSIGASYMIWQPDYNKSSLLNIGGFYNLGEKFGFAAGFKNNSLPEVQLTDVNGNLLNAFTPKEFLIDLGIAYKIIENLSASANFRYISSDMGGSKSGSAVAIDINGFYRLNNINLGLGITNLGSKIDYGSLKYNLPARIKGGISYMYSITETHSLLGSAEINYQLLPSDYSGIVGGVGIEYQFKKMIALRGGYNFGNEEKTTPNFITLGAGISFKGITFDAAYWLSGDESLVNNTMLFSLGWSF